MILRERGETWCAVTIAGIGGWMLTEHLAFGSGAEVEFGGLWHEILSEAGAEVFSSADESAASRWTREEEDFLIVGQAEDCYILWLTEAGEYVRVRQSDMGWRGLG